MGRTKERALGLDDPVEAIRGVGPKRAGVLRQAEIETVEDLLLHLPFRYEDRSGVVAVGEVSAGATVTVRVEVRSRRRARRGVPRVEATVADDSGSLQAVWFRQMWRYHGLEPGTELWLHGKAGCHDGRLQLVNPVVEAGEEGETLHVAGLVPIYERVGSLGPAALRRLLAAALEGLDGVGDPLPRDTVRRLELPDRQRALEEIHRPPGGADPVAWNAARSPAHRRLILEEFLAFQTALLLQRRGTRRGRGFATGGTGEMRRRALAVLPFEPTPGQRGALDVILGEMAAPEPMHRLLQGDVGSGKTAVAAVALLVAALDGGQGALMAPTEILAEQHAATLGPWAAELGIPLACLTGNRPAEERRVWEERLAAGEPALVVGTHALVQPGLELPGLRLAVVDEQHRFGVRQRVALRRKGVRDDRWPDLLVMTATPIPRTLALTLYGDLEACTIPDKPPGRRPVETRVVSPDAWPEIVAFLERRAARGEQVYVVAPRITESRDEVEGSRRGEEKSPPGGERSRQGGEGSREERGASGKGEIRTATGLREELARRLPDARVGLLHGGLPVDEKLVAMEDLAAGRCDILVATTVVEVGVDVPAATGIVVEHAERFGLAQLHQLRGRVGRGEAESACLLVAHEPLSPQARERLLAMKETDDGFALAEVDLELRGPGEVLGTRQAGVPGRGVGDPFRDHRWLAEARDEARRLVASGEPEARAWCDRVEAFWKRRFDLVRGG